MMIQNKYQDKINVTAFTVYNSLKKILKYFIHKCKKYFYLNYNLELESGFLAGITVMDLWCGLTLAGHQVPTKLVQIAPLFS